VYASLGAHQQRIDQLDALSALDSTRPERLVAVGLAHAERGRDSQALLVLGRAVERFPDVPQSHAALGHVWLNIAERRTDATALLKAIEALTEAATHSACRSEALSDLGRALTLSGDLPAAERALRSAVTRLPVAAEAFLRLAAVTERQRRDVEARDALLQYAALVGDREPLAGIATRIADLSVRSGEPLLAVRWFERAIDEAGPSPALLGRLADAAWRGGDAVRARAAVADGLQLAPDDAVLVALRDRVASDPGRPAGRLPGS
jgi:tetratricopeptide (TPR) repeat protein